MANYEDRASCGCKEIFCCIFSTSRPNRHLHQNGDYPPSFSSPTIELYPTQLLEQGKVKQNVAYHAPDVGQHVHQQGSSRSSSDINETFSDYINLAKIKIRTMSNVGSDGGGIVYPNADEVHYHEDAEKKANANDLFSDYINRAKLKIMKTSSIGSKRIISFRKRESFTQ